MRKILERIGIPEELGNAIVHLLEESQAAIMVNRYRRGIFSLG